MIAETSRMMSVDREVLDFMVTVPPY